jgi:hypothetical protein
LNAIRFEQAFANLLSQDEKLLAMELIWRDLTRVSNNFKSPRWHEDVLRERLRNPMTGEALGIDEAFKKIEEWQNAGKASN